MRNLDSKETVIKILERVIKLDNKKKNIDALFDKEIIEKGKMSNSEIKSILGLRTDLYSLSIEKLYILYYAIASVKDDIPKVDELFEEQEIKRAESLQAERLKAQFPIKLKVHKQTFKEDYVAIVSAKKLEEWQDNGVIKLDANMARESIITSYNNQLISHIAYNDDRAREIGQKMATNNFYSNGIRLHLVRDGSENYEFIQPSNPEEEGEGQLIIKSGNLALIEGNHRMKGLEYALLDNPDMYLYMTVFLSVGTIKDGQFIIDQEEKREPLKKEVVKTYASSYESNIMRDLKSEDIDEVYKFCKTLQEINQGAGFVLESIVIDFTKEFYDMENKNQEIQTRKWLVEFLNELAQNLHKDFENYLSVRKIKWDVSPYAFAGFIYLSSVLKDQQNWRDLLSNILSQIDFSIENKPWKEGMSRPDKMVVNYLKEVVKNVLG